MRRKTEATDEKIIEVGGSEEAGVRNAERQRRSRARRRGIGIGILCVLLAAFVGYLIAKNWEFKSYKVVERSETDYENTANYIRFSDNLLKYTADGVSYINDKGNTVWTTGINMTEPMAAASGDYAVVADLNGNTVCVFNTDGEVSSQEMPYPISDVDVADQGVFAVILESEDTNYVNLYNKKGEILYEIRMTIDKSGYPFDISLSNNGEKLFVSSMKVGSSVMENQLIAYNFGEVGQNSNADRIVGTYVFTDQVFSKVQFLDNDTVAAFGTKSMEIYTMKEKPAQKESLAIDGEIRSIFYGDDYIGVICKDTASESENAYRICTYNLRGKIVFSDSVDFDYDNIYADENEIIVTGGNHCKIFRKNGTVKFSGTMDAKIRSVVPSGNFLEYVVVYEDETRVIRLKAARAAKDATTDSASDAETATPGDGGTP